MQMDGPIKRRWIRRRTLRNTVIGVVILGAGLAGVWITQNLLEQRAEQAQQLAQAEAEAAAAAIARQVAQVIEDHAGQLEALASADETRALFEQGDSQALADAASQNLERFDAGLKLRLIRPGQQALDPDARPPLSYASLDLLRQAQQTASPMRAELHMPGSEQAHVVLVRRSSNEAGELIGLLHLSLQPDVIDQALAAAVTPDSYHELKQYVPGGSPVVIARGGDERLKGGVPSTTAAVSGSNWVLEFWPHSTAAISTPRTDGAGMSWMLPAAGLILLIAGLLYWRQNRAGRQGDDSVVYGGAIKAIMDGAHPGLSRLVPNLAQGKQPRQSPAGADNQPPGPAREDDDITSVAVPIAPRQQSAPSAKPAKPESGESPAMAAIDIDPIIFRTYDIRGIVATQLTPPVVHELGRAIGSEARDRNESCVIVGRDGRTSSPELADALRKGLCAAGVDVIDIGLVPTPVLYFATHFLEPGSGVMVTGSHNGPEYNGLKIVLAGETLSGDTVLALHQRIKAGKLHSGAGSQRSADINTDYIRRVTEDIPTAMGNAYRIVVDCGNGAAGALAPQVYRALGHDVTELYCDIDGNFPNHHPDPGQPENLKDLIGKVKEIGADLGFAFDGDGDRLGVVDAEGNIIWPDRQLMLLARDVLERNPGAPIIFDVKCSRYLKAIIELSGGKPLMWKTGHSLIKNKMKEVNAPLAGEMSGHIFFKERWYGFDDAIYTGARLLEVLGRQQEKPTEIFADLPGGIATPELRIKLAEKNHARAMQALRKKLDVGDGELTDIDGLRLEFADGWGLIRPSNTSPYLVARFEAENETALARIQKRFHDALVAVSPALKPPF